MPAFLRLLTFHHPLLEDETEETQPGPIEVSA
jgi:hypothetical protein